MKKSLLTSLCFLIAFFSFSFAQAQSAGCVIGNATATNISYKVNGVTHASLTGLNLAGKTVEVSFKTATGTQPSNFSLVAYKAPAAVFTEATAHLQTVHDSETKTVPAGTHKLTVSVPNCFYQVDFVKGCIINQLGPAGSNNFYGKQNRLIGYNNGGTMACVTAPPVASTPCVQTSQCFDFAYSYVVNANGTVTIKFEVTVDCNHDLSNVAFELPASATASAYTGPGQVENPTNNPFRSIKWNTNAGGKNGAVRTFTYTISQAAFNSMTTIRAHAKASTTVGQVTFNKTGCGTTTPPTPPAPVCTLAANISGPASICPSNTLTYSYTTTLQAGAAYTWTVPAGWSIVSGQNTNTLVAKANPGASAGNIGVNVTKNGCTAASDIQAVAISGNCGTTPPPVTPPTASPCIQSNQCFVFAYSYVTNANGTVTIKFDVTINCGNDLSNVAFQLPNGGTASAHTGSNQVENPTNNPFYSIKFEGLNGKNGAVRSFTYTITAAQFAALTTIKASAKAAGTVGQVTFNKLGCNPTPPPACTVVANISGPDTVCAYNDEPYTFSTPAQAGATYTWSVPMDWTIDSGAATNTIVVYAGAESGNVSVTVTNTCGTATDEQYVFADETCGIIAPLPVQMLSFEGAASQAGIELKWATAMEKDNDRFEVQRSADGKRFEAIGTVKGRGTVNNRSDYRFTDSKAVAGYVYYRLRQVDFDGKSEMSKVIRVSRDTQAGATMKLYPNPVTDGRFTISLDKPSLDASIVISDLNGKQLHSSRISNGSTEVTMETGRMGMKPGMYLVTVKDAKTATAQKLIIK